MVLARCEDSAVCVMCSASGLREVSPRKPCWSRVFTVRKVFARKRGVEGYSKQTGYAEAERDIWDWPCGAS